MSDIFDHMAEAFEDEFLEGGRGHEEPSYNFRPPYAKPAQQTRICAKCEHEFNTSYACKCPQCGGWTNAK